MHAGQLKLVIQGVHLFSVNTVGHGPGGGDVIHNPLAQAFGHLVQLEEVPHAVKHLVIAVSVGIHLLEDSCHITEDGGIEERYEKGREKNKLFGLSGNTEEAQNYLNKSQI